MYIFRPDDRRGDGGDEAQGRPERQAGGAAAMDRLHYAMLYSATAC